MSDCIFCKIIAGEIPSEKVFESEKVYAFKDIHPLAKEHYLFIPKNHSPNIGSMSSEDFAAIGSALKSFLQERPQLKDGYRVVTNKGEWAGQTVFHTHFHLLGGEKLKGFGA